MFEVPWKSKSFAPEQRIEPLEGLSKARRRTLTAIHQLEAQPSSQIISADLPARKSNRPARIVEETPDDFFWNRRSTGGGGAPLRNREGHISALRRRPPTPPTDGGSRVEAHNVPQTHIASSAEPPIIQQPAEPSYPAPASRFARTKGTFGPEDSDNTRRRAEALEWQACLQKQIEEKKARERQEKAAADAAERRRQLKWEQEAGILPVAKESPPVQVEQSTVKPMKSTSSNASESTPQQLQSRIPRLRREMPSSGSEKLSEELQIMATTVERLLQIAPRRTDITNNKGVRHVDKLQRVRASAPGSMTKGPGQQRRIMTTALHSGPGKSVMEAPKKRVLSAVHDGEKTSQPRPISSQQHFTQKPSPAQRLPKIKSKQDVPHSKPASNHPTPRPPSSEPLLRSSTRRIKVSNSNQRQSQQSQTRESVIIEQKEWKRIKALTEPQTNLQPAQPTFQDSAESEEGITSALQQSKNAVEKSDTSVNGCSNLLKKSKLECPEKNGGARPPNKNSLPSSSALHNDSDSSDIPPNNVHQEAMTTWLTSLRSPSPPIPTLQFKDITTRSKQQSISLSVEQPKDPPTSKRPSSDEQKVAAALDQLRNFESILVEERRRLDQEMSKTAK
ncbi:uncharacterized protein SPPG_07305 [Spizellomyces punctatus DAOM BR117]|uniref:Uncharacterized protein n=1 Tax=Spizellomyces punctatus (strain DAOM BR117) TaxID=645134 RepID=A0A0L0H9P9_SPIPD|nr:uncharacterized protein SPPG_07305 [Spizellomyces punctatus DAOM BR117]KNC97378.1 hypothetical protein SPPG_07305 [Spizellomyces punctatus DAOM BR117]|eukprot:XP_016605418.1 hypothetical protein SPPG_07305 [Spizellomyces punctatus DAOM BR117]